MDYSTELKRINDKYYNKIKKAYSKYIKNFDSIPDLTQNVYIIPDDKCIGDYKDLAVGKNRGRCDADTGNIYIRESAFCDHLLIHEFVHRLSRNYDGHQWINGIGIESNFYDLSGFNELFTEWFTYHITHTRENSNYQKTFFLIKHFKLRHPHDFKKMIMYYFSSNTDYAVSLIFKYYGNDIDGQFITSALLQYYYLSTDNNLHKLKMFLRPQK